MSFVLIYFRNIQFILCIMLVLVLFGCKQMKKLDQSGGYYDEETGNYRYIFPKEIKNASSAQTVKLPHANETESFQAKLTKIEEPSSVWVQLQHRQNYMKLSHPLTKYNRNDQTKEIRIVLSYVDPMLVGKSSKKFRSDWKKYVVQKMKSEFLGKNVHIRFQLKSKAKQFNGMIFQKRNTQQGKIVFLNLNLWMVQNGYSYYIFENGKAPQHKKFLNAQQKAKEKKLGLWKYF